MNPYLKINNEPSPDGMAHFIVNESILNYVNLGGPNNQDTIDCVHKFMVDYGIWQPCHRISVHYKPHLFRPPPKYHNISFIIRFYCMFRYYRKRMIQQQNQCAKQMVAPMNNIVTIPQIVDQTQPEPPVPIVKQLTNPNISHDINKKPSSIPESGIEPLTKNVKFEKIEEDSDSLDNLYDDLTSEDPSEKQKKKKTKKTKNRRHSSDTDHDNESDDFDNSPDSDYSNDSDTNESKSESEVNNIINDDVGDNSNIKNTKNQTRRANRTNRNVHSNIDSITNGDSDSDSDSGTDSDSEVENLSDAKVSISPDAINDDDENDSPSRNQKIKNNHVQIKLVANKEKKNIKTPAKKSTKPQTKNTTATAATKKINNKQTSNKLPVKSTTKPPAKPTTKSTTKRSNKKSTPPKKPFKKK